MANNREHRNESAQAHLSRTGHSLSHKLSFTAACGMLLPTFWDYASPGDSYSLRTDYDLSRALPLLSPATLDIEVVTDYFFVPMTLMYTPWDEVYSGTNSVFSSNFQLDDTQTIGDFSWLYVGSRGLTDNHYKSFHVGESFYKSLYRLFDLMGYNPTAVTGASDIDVNIGDLPYYSLSASAPLSDCPVAPYPFLAYQAIYQYFYRDEEFEKFDNTCFNMDIYAGVNIPRIITQQSDSVIISNPYYRYFQLRYVNKRSDYFTDVSRSALITTENLGRSLLDFGSDVFGLDGYLSDKVSGDFLPVALDSEGYPVDDYSGTSVGYTDDSSLAGLVNTATLRMMFANEKLLRVTQSARKNYDDQTLAHFGVNVPHDVKHQITHFGHDVMKYQVSEVVSTAQTDQGALGEQAGKLYGIKKSDGMSHFKAPVHGVVMAITFIRPSYSYVVPYERKALYKAIGDWWRPEYDHIGMQPIFRGEIQHNANSSDGSVGHFFDVVGWQYRYKELKQSFNRVTRAFVGGTYQSYIMASVPNGHLVDGRLASYYPATYNWLENSDIYAFKVLPSDTDGIFSQSFCSLWQIGDSELSSLLDTIPESDYASYFGSWMVNNYDLVDSDKVRDVYTKYGFDFRNRPWEIYATDPFILNSDIKCTKVSFMSQNSLPKLDM